MAFLLILVLAAGAEAPVELTLAPFGGVGVEAKKVSFYAEYFAEKLAGPRLKVTTPSAIAAALGAERQRQLLGCTDDSTSCIAELAGALGSDGVVTGQFARLGASVALTVKVVKGNGETLASFSGRCDSEEELLDLLENVAWKLRVKVTGQAEPEPPRRARPVASPAPALPQPTEAGPGGAPRLSGTGPSAPLAPGTPGLVPAQLAAPPGVLLVSAPPAAVEARSGARRFFWVPLVLGAVAAGASVPFWLMARGTAGELERREFKTRGAVDDAVQRGRVQNGVALGLALGGAVGAVVSLGFLFDGGDEGAP